MRNEFWIFTLVSVVGIGIAGYFWHWIWWLYIAVLPVVLLGMYDMYQTRHAIMRNYPVFGRGRYIMEELRPKIYQYFVESDIDGRPFDRTLRTLAYTRAKGTTDTAPFGTQLNVYEEGYEWMNHSIVALDAHHLNQHPKVLIGSPDCQQPYNASILNVSAMSFGSLSTNAVLALNGGAKLGGFAHNTGEGGISPHHLEQGGDLIYQIGTGYFGCRTKDGKFSDDLFAEKAALENVKMIEIKLSQGAKPGHGGILPAAKNTPEIAAIRNVEPHTTVFSPPHHTAFTTPLEMLEFIARLRRLSGGKPIGFKLCVGIKSEFLAICKAMKKTGIYPDFITVDGGEGGTGAAPLEFSNYVGMPFKEGLAFVYDALVGFDLKQHIKIIASGKIITGFHILRAMALGADACNSARAMMLALGCIQALQCNLNSCPTGVATQDPELVKGLVVTDKKRRVANYHKETVESFVELMGAAGLTHPNQISRAHLYRRVSMREIKRYDEIYPYIPAGSLLHADTCPDAYKIHMKEASPDSFAPVVPVF
ncbi:FMN-binding glutamate synthase family protein [Sphingobacteriales bacterium UPWRP_1]|nr:FMN-binding glutamate synthase family protein [Sphingobacteriales bacterium TSM_CSM]PSJ71795.1 FMN-binding glutamate synthase family protein [Sphingobacteriales bacterium UPWRP_1]